MNEGIPPALQVAVAANGLRRVHEPATCPCNKCVQWRTKARLEAAEPATSTVPVEVATRRSQSDIVLGVVWRANKILEVSLGGDCTPSLRGLAEFILSSLGEVVTPPESRLTEFPPEFFSEGPEKP